MSSDLPRAPRRALVIGSGQRVREAALPALSSLPERFELAGIRSRKPKTIQSGEREHPVLPLEDLNQAALDDVDLIYLVVKKPAVPLVLRQLGALNLARVDLLIETPVLLTKHLGHRKLLRPFRNVWVSEDCSTLPWIDVAFEAAARSDWGPLRRAFLDRSGYAYHGVALLRTLFAGQHLVGARRQAAGEGLRKRTYRYSAGGVGEVLEPRDYDRGALDLEFAGGRLSDRPDTGDGLTLEPIVEGGACLGFRAGDVEARLSPAEAELMGTPKGSSGVWAWMDGAKRVGFHRLLAAIADGRPAYSVDDALDDALIDYHLERLGRYRPNPLTSAGGSLSGPLFGLLTRVAGR